MWRGYPYYFQRAQRVSIGIKLAKYGVNGLMIELNIAVGTFEDEIKAGD